VAFDAAAATATGQLIFLPVLARAAEGFGWRSVTWIVAAAAVCAIVPVVWLVRDRPSDVGMLPYGATEAPPPATARTNPIAIAFDALRRASKSAAFWILAGTFFICGASTNGFGLKISTR